MKNNIDIEIQTKDIWIKMLVPFQYNTYLYVALLIWEQKLKHKTGKKKDANIEK